jgi:nucleotide-binding universal stress UspA family protein
MTTPFTRVLVAFDGSEPAQVALGYAIELGRAGAQIVLANVVNEAPLITQSSTTVAVYDPTPMMEALDAQARGMLDAAEARCRAAQIEPAAVLFHELPVAGIVGLAAEYQCDLIAMATHAREGVARAFLGSTAEGVLRSSHVPVLVTRAGIQPLKVRGALFRNVLVAVDDSEPSRAAVATAAKIARTLEGTLTLCNVADTRDLYDKAVTYGYDPQQIADEILEHAQGIVEEASRRAALAPPAATEVVEGEPVAVLVAEATRRNADLIVIGSHGRTGLRRLALGSVAEHVVRRSPVPVLVVRT